MEGSRNCVYSEQYQSHRYMLRSVVSLSACVCGGTYGTQCCQSWH